MAFTSYDPDSPAEFARLAEVHIQGVRDSWHVELHYNMDSLEQLDAIVESIPKPKDLGRMVLVIGSFLGEALRRMYGGRWEWNQQFKSWAVVVPIRNGGETGAFPFAKVEKRFRYGKGDSIAYFVHVLDAKVEGRLPEPSRQKS